MRKPLLIGAGAIAAILAIAVAALLLVDIDKFREPIRAQLEKRLKRTVTIGKLGLKIFPLSIRLQDVTIGESPKFHSTAPFVAAQEMYVRVGIAALLRKQVDVQSLQILQPAVELIKNADGEWNVSTLGESSGSGGGKSSVDVSELRVENGRVAITDLQLKKPRAVYDRIDVTLRDFSPGKRFHLDAQAHLPAKGTELVKAQVTGDTPGPGKSFDLSGLDGDVSLEAVSLAGLQAFLGSTPSQAAKAVFNGKAQFQNRSGVLAGTGHLEIAEPRLKDPARIDFELRDESATGILTVSNAKLKLGALAANGNVQVRTRETPSRIEADFRADNAALADLLHLASALGVADGIDGTGVVSLAAHLGGPAGALAYTATGTLRDSKLTVASLSKPVEIQTVGLKATRDEAALDNLVGSVASSHFKGAASVRDFAHPNVRFNAEIDRLDTAELQQLVVPSNDKPSNDKKASGSGAKGINGSGTISVGTLTYNQLALSDVHATCKLENGIIRLDPLTAKLFGGAQAGSIAVDTRQQQTAYDVHVKLQRVDAKQLLSATTSVRQLSGLLSGDINLNASPHAGQDLARALNGNVQILLTDGRLAGTQLLNEMAGIAKFMGYAPKSEAFTTIVKLAGTMKIQNGVANTDDLQLVFDGGSLAAAGAIGLADQQLKLRVTAVLAKGLAQLGGGNSIAGLMSTALSNNKGELVIPALVSGSFDKPRFEPDPQRIAKMRLEGLLPTKDNPNGAASTIQGILGALKGGKSSQAEPKSPAEPGANEPPKKKGIFDIIDSVRKNAERK